MATTWFANAGKNYSTKSVQVWEVAGVASSSRVYNARPGPHMRELEVVRPMGKMGWRWGVNIYKKLSTSVANNKYTPSRHWYCVQQQKNIIIILKCIPLIYCSIIIHEIAFYHMIIMVHTFTCAGARVDVNVFFINTSYYTTSAPLYTTFFIQVQPCGGLNNNDLPLQR